MLVSLSVKNLALIQNITIDLRGGFSVFTGETGAGKSILMGAIDLLLGGRASTSAVRSGEKEASVVGVFHISDNPAVKAIFRTAGIPDQDEFTVTRIIRRSGRNRVVINKKEISLQVLRNLGRHLFDLHGQHDHQALLSDEAARHILDQFRQVRPPLSKYRHAWQAYSAARRALSEHARRIQLLREKRDYLEFQFSEIDDLELKEQELDSLQDEYRLVSSSTERSEAAGAIARIISGDSTAGSLQEGIGTLQKLLGELIKYDSSFREWAASVSEASAVFNDLEATINAYVDDTAEEYSPARMDELNSRISRIQRLMKKYDCTFEGLLQKRDELRRDLDNIDSADYDGSRLEKDLQEARSILDEAGAHLDAVRREAAEFLDRQITGKMAFLGFRGGAFLTDFIARDEPGEWGLSDPVFMVRTNRGEPFMRLSETASGGEISRIMLAIKVILAENDPVPILVFDEIDTGVGGTLAAAIAEEIVSLSQHHQLFVISHLQQIASRADNHYAVYKTEKEGRVITQIRELSSAERVDEIARMLGDESDLSREHARKILEE
ncbi:MAG: DNA repair protein RecN [Fibrobacterota bacterium]